MSLIYSSAKKDFLYWNVLIFIVELDKWGKGSGLWTQKASTRL